MIINIKKALKDVKVERKKKIKKLKNKKFKDHIKYEWDLKGTSEDETLEDFHLFCISIVRDLMKNNFKTNEEGNVCYEHLNEVVNKDTIKEIGNMYAYILYEKYENMKRKIAKV